MTRSHPARPPFAFRVGIVGHRWDKLGVRAGRTREPGADRDEQLALTADIERRLEATLRDLLGRVESVMRPVSGDAASGYDQTTPARFVLVSGLAEGADRIAARVAVGGGWHLWAVLPFASERYARDFDEAWAAPRWSRPGSLAEYHEACRAAQATIVLDGDPDAYDGYEPLGRTVLNFSDLLIAVWDGAAARGPGGTANLLADARRVQAPIIRIDPEEPELVWLEDRSRPDEGRSLGLVGLADRLEGLVHPPQGRVAASARADFERERPLPARRGNAYKLLSGLLGLRGVGVFVPTAIVWPLVVLRSLRSDKPAPYDETAMASWRADLAQPLGPAPGLAERVAEHVAPLYGWCDQLAERHAGRYRFAFTAIFSLAWIAAVAAVTGLVAHVQGWAVAPVFAVVEGGVIGAILLFSLLPRYRQSHRRWIDYRLLAEQSRSLAFLWPLAASSRWLRVPVATDPEDPRLGWIGWRYRALVRSLPLPTGCFDAGHTAAVRALLAEVPLAGQKAHHDGTAARLSHLAHQVHLRTELLFGAAAVAAAAGLWLAGPELLALLRGQHHPPRPGGDGGAGVHGVLAALAVFFPARAAALHGWAGQADLQTTARRSADTARRLGELERTLGTLAVTSSTTLGAIGVEAAEAMESELIGWWATSVSRPLQRV